MKAYEFKSVIETRRQVEAEFAFFREMMEKDHASTPKLPTVDSRCATKDVATEQRPKKAYEFQSVIETRRQVEAEFAFFREMMEKDRDNTKKQSHTNDC